jgi:hypothetical protein
MYYPAENAIAEQINGILNEFGLKTIKSIQIATMTKAVEIYNERTHWSLDLKH